METLDVPAVLKVVGFSALAVLVVGWLVISFTQPSRRRSIIEWISSTAMYVGLLCIFLNLGYRFWGESWAVVAAVGLLVVVFGSGLIVSLVLTVRELAGRSAGGEGSATH
jgi:hypothetical protein